MSLAKYFILTVVKKDSVGSVVCEEKQCSERSQIFHFNSSEVKYCSGRSQRCPFNSSEVKQRSECIQ